MVQAGDEGSKIEFVLGVHKPKRLRNAALSSHTLTIVYALLLAPSACTSVPLSYSEF